MTQLTIQPVVYEGQRLREVGERIITVFNSKFHDFKINDCLDLACLEPIILHNDENADPPQKSRIVGSYLLRFLSQYGSPILGITSLLTTRSKNDGWVYGQGRGDSNSAFVSTARNEFDRLDSDVHIERIVIESLHELGHVFNLRHHDSPITTRNRKYCPMTVSHESDVHKGKITWEEYISSRDATAFCAGCYDKLSMPEKQQQK